MSASAPDQIAASLRALIEGLLPEAVATPKYGGVIYHHAPDAPELGICGVFAYTKHVSLEFARGGELDDPSGLLQGKGKARRHLKFTETADITDPTVAQFIRAASKLPSPGA